MSARFRILRETRVGAVLAAVVVAAGCASGAGGRAAGDVPPSTTVTAPTTAPGTPPGPPGAGAEPPPLVPLTVSPDGRTAHTVEVDDSGAVTVTVVINHPDDTSWADTIRALLAARARAQAAGAPGDETADPALGLGDLAGLGHLAGPVGPGDGGGPGAAAVSYDDVPGGGQLRYDPAGPGADALRRWVEDQRRRTERTRRDDAARL